MKLPKDLENLILQYHAEIVHTQKMELCHAEMLVKHFLIHIPRRVRYVGYFLWL